MRGSRGPRQPGGGKRQGGPPGVATDVLSVLMGRAASDLRKVAADRRGLLQSNRDRTSRFRLAVHPSRRAQSAAKTRVNALMGGHLRLTLNAREPHCSTEKIPSVVLRCERKLGPKGGGRSRWTHDSFAVRPERSGEARERPYDRPRQDDGERKGAAPQHRKGSFRAGGTRAKARPVGQRPERSSRGSAEGDSRRDVEGRERHYDRRRQDDEHREQAAPRRRKSSFRHPEAAAKRPSKGDGQSSRRSPTWLSSKQSKSDKPISVGRVSFEARQRRAPQDDGERRGERSHRNRPTGPLTLSTPKDRRPAPRPLCKTSPSPPTKPACGSTAFSKRISRA